MRQTKPLEPVCNTGHVKAIAMVSGLLFCLAALVGCTAVGTRTQGSAVNPGMQNAWQPQPTSLRIYSSLRFVMEDEMPLLECRIELLDAMGDPVKASGKVKCELFASSGLGDGSLGARLYGWDIEMTSLDDQRAFYDPPVRGYLFRLRLADIEPANRPTTLRVTFTPARGAVLSDEAEIRPGSGAG